MSVKKKSVKGTTKRGKVTRIISPKTRNEMKLLREQRSRKNREQVDSAYYRVVKSLLNTGKNPQDLAKKIETITTFKQRRKESAERSLKNAEKYRAKAELAKKKRRETIWKAKQVIESNIPRKRAIYDEYMDKARQYKTTYDIYNEDMKEELLNYHKYMAMVSAYDEVLRSELSKK